MSPQVQVLLVGGRQTPNVIGVLTQKPALVEFLVSKDEKPDTMRSLRATLRSIQGVRLARGHKRIDPFAFQANLDACHEICERHGGESVAFNLTGSTKIMALAAYQVARERGASAFYVDTANHRILPLVGAIAETRIDLTIEMYLKAYGRTPVYTFDFGRLSFSLDAALESAQVLAEATNDTRDFLLSVRRSQGSGRRRVRTSSQTWPVAEKLGRLGAVDLDTDRSAVYVRTNDDWNFLTGGWLEVYVWNEMRNQKAGDGKALFQECALGLEIPSGSAGKEIDVVGLYQAQLILCSCKSEDKPFRTETLDELSAVANLIGGRYCSRIFVTNGLLPDNSRKREEFLAHAAQREIVVVTGAMLRDVGKIAAKQAYDPDYWRV